MDPTDLNNLKMETKFVKILSSIKSNFGMSFMETQDKTKSTKRERKKQLNKINQMDKKVLLLQNFTFLAYMLGFKKVFDECFDLG